jgi:hypothetical protein
MSKSFEELPLDYQIFTEAAQLYLDNQSPPPFIIIESTFKKSPIEGRFSKTLLTTMIKKPQDMFKPYQIAKKFGYGGYSRGEKNGIFVIRKQDTGLLRSLESLTVKHVVQMCRDIESSPSDLNKFKPVKIVWHNPNGERIIGTYNTSNDKMFFLDFAKY